MPYDTNLFNRDDDECTVEFLSITPKTIQRECVVCILCSKGRKSRFSAGVAQFLCTEKVNSARSRHDAL